MPIWKTDRLDIHVDQDNVYNGTLKTPDCELKWIGYTTQLHDGELKISPVDPNAYITGVCNGNIFRFERCKLVYGVWPGFLLFYE
jgi:hypothetical protein